MPSGHFEPARAFGLERWIADETPGKEPVQVEEGRLGDAFAIGQCRDRSRCLLAPGPRPARRRVLEAVELVTPHRDVGHQPLGDLGAPFERDGVMPARPVLLRNPPKGRVAGVEFLAFQVRSRRSAHARWPGRTSGAPTARRASPRDASVRLTGSPSSKLRFDEPSSEPETVPDHRAFGFGGLHPHPPRGEPVAAAVERVGMMEW